MENTIIATRPLEVEPEFIPCSSLINHPNLMKHLAEGCTIREAAGKVFLSPKAVANILTDLRERYSCKNTAHLVYFLMQKGFLK